MYLVRVLNLLAENSFVAAPQFALHTSFSELSWTWLPGLSSTLYLQNHAATVYLDVVGKSLREKFQSRHFSYRKVLHSNLRSQKVRRAALGTWLGAFLWGEDWRQSH